MFLGLEGDNLLGQDLSGIMVVEPEGSKRTGGGKEAEGNKTKDKSKEMG